MAEPTVSMVLIPRSHPLTGFRWFCSDSGKLASWVPGPNEARCGFGHSHIAPDDGCTCGLRVFPPERDFPDGWAGFYALVAVWGRVIDDGLAAPLWRVQFAEITALAVVHSPRWEPRGRAEPPARQYGVPLVSLGEIRAALKRTCT